MASYIYVGGVNGSNVSFGVRKIGTTDSAVVLTSPDNHTNIQAVITDGTYTYAFGNPSELYKYRNSDMTVVSSVSLGSGIGLCLAQDSNYIYASVGFLIGVYRYIKKIRKTDMVVVATSWDYATTGNVVYALYADDYDDYVYFSTEDSGVYKGFFKVSKSFPDRGTKLTGNFSAARFMAGDSTYIYCNDKRIKRSDLSTTDLPRGYISQYIYGGYLYAAYSSNLVKVDLNTLTEITSVSIPYTLYCPIACDTEYLYIGGYGANTYQKRSLTDLSLISTSSTYTEDCREIATYISTPDSGKYIFACGEDISGSFQGKILKFDAENLTYIAGANNTYSLDYGKGIIADGYCVYCQERGSAKIGKLDYDLNEINTIEYSNVAGVTNNLLAQDNTYIYSTASAGSVPAQAVPKLRKIRKSDFVDVTPLGVFTGETVQSGDIIIDDNYLYVVTGGIGGTYLHKLNKNTFVEVLNTRYGSNQFRLDQGNTRLAQDNTYIYLTARDYANTAWYIFKVRKSDFVVVDSVLYGANNPFGMSADSLGNLFVNHLTLKKYDTSTLTLQDTVNNLQSASSYVNNVYDDNYVYSNIITGVNYDVSYITRFDKSNLSLTGACVVYIPNQVIEKLAYSEENILSLPPSFCSGTYYNVSASTCGNTDGKITILNQFGCDSYFNVYDIILTDVSGNSYTYVTGNTGCEYTGLTSNFYTLTATPKPAYWYYYGNDTCTFDWIPLEDTDTSISLVGTKLKHAICEGFGSQTGRILLQFSDSGTTTGWTYSLYNSRHELIDVQFFTGTTFTGVTNIVTYVSPDDYYAILENDSGCKYLTDLIHIKATLLYTVGGIQRLFITPWSASTSYNYYSSSDEDWYVTGVDTLQYTSTKISEYLDLADFWYEIKLHTATMQYSETFQRDQNGLTYRETVTITIPKAENSKWKQLVNILTGRYIVVFQDNHDQWWTCFYRWGAEVKSYSLSDNQYVITFIHPSVDKMLTAIDYDYVKLNIL